jgi:hypothetical protein
MESIASRSPELRFDGIETRMSIVRLIIDTRLA